MPTLQVSRLTRRRCDILAPANLFLVFSVLQVRIQGSGESLLYLLPTVVQECVCACVCTRAHTHTRSCVIGDHLAVSHALLLHPGERCSLEVLSQRFKGSWTIWQDLRRQPAGLRARLEWKRSGSQRQEMKVAKALPKHLLWINFPGCT